MKLAATLKLKTLTTLLPIAVFSAALHAGTPATISAPSGSGKEAAITPAKEPAIDVSGKDLVVLYNNKDNPIIEKFSLIGEFATQWASGDSNQGSYGSRDLPSNTRWGDIDMRRWRLGFNSQWFHDFKVTGIIDINPDWNPFYKDIYQLSLTYAPSDAFNLGIGKRKAQFFSQEFNTRSKELITFEQSLLVNTLIPKELTGAWAEGKVGNWVYALAGWAGDYETEFSKFNAGAVIQAQLGYDFAKSLNVDRALVRFDYQGSTSTTNSFGPGLFSNAFSLNTTFQNGRFYGYSDLLGGIGQGHQGDVWGASLTPTYFLVPNKLQAVLRYQYAHGDNNGLKLQQRYEGLAPDLTAMGVGSDYNAVYAGLNYYIYGHNLKLMTGVEYNSLTGGPQNFSGWTYLAGLRASF